MKADRGRLPSLLMEDVLLLMEDVLLLMVSGFRIPLPDDDSLYK